MKQHYVKAVTHLLQQEGVDVERVLTGLKDILIAKGHTSLHTQILVSVLHTLRESTTSTAAHITVAKQHDAQLLHKEIEASLAKIGGTQKAATITTDATLIGGYIATYNSRCIDASHKSKLVKLYRNITA